MFDEFGLVMVVVSDMSRSVHFYRDVLGLKFQFESPDWSQFQLGKVGLGLHLHTADLPVNAAGGISFGFYVNNLDDTLAELAEKGVDPIRVVEEDFGHLAIVPDPDGYGIQLCQSKYTHN